MSSDLVDGNRPLPLDYNARLLDEETLRTLRALSADGSLRCSVASEDGGLVLHQGDRALCSPQSPIAEAREWAAGFGTDSETVVVFGFGAGHHVEALCRRTDATCIIYEPDLQRLRLALNDRPFDLGTAQVVTNTTALIQAVTRGLNDLHQLTLAIWPPIANVSPAACNDAIDAVRHAVSLAAVTAGTLRRRLRVWCQNTIGNMVRAVGRPTANHLGRWLEGRPVVIVAAGPSLDKNVEQLKRLEGRAAIFAVNTSIGALERAGVRADLAVTIEVLDVSTQFVDLELNRDVPIAPSLCANASLYGQPGGVFPFADRLPVFLPVIAAAGFAPGVASGGSVANTAFALAECSGASEVILVGQDLAYTGGGVYARGTVFEEMTVDLERAGRARLGGLAAKERIAASCPEADATVVDHAVEMVPAWGGQGEVASSLAFNYFRGVFENWARLMRDRLRLTNATEGGSRIAGFDEQPLADVVARLPATGRPIAAVEAALGAAPRIEASVVRRLFESERAKLEDAKRVCQELGQGRVKPQALQAAVKGAPFLAAACWNTLAEAASRPDVQLEQLTAAVAADADTVLDWLEDGCRKL